MPRKHGHGRRVKRRTPLPEDPDYAKCPKSFVFARGDISPAVSKLCHDWRETFSPHTAKKLKVYRRDKVKALTRSAKLLGVSHLQIITCSTTGTFLRISRLPHGPTIQFHVDSFETCLDVKKLQRRPQEDPFAYTNPALPVLNNFANSSKPHVKMTQTLLTNLFPQLRIDKVRLTDCRRIVLFHLNEDTEMIDVRHYVITGHRQTKNKAIKRLEKGRLPKRPGTLKDISDLITRPDAFFSDSDGEAEEMELGQRFRKLQAQSQALIKLVEVGPRMTLSIHKIMAGMLDGEVIYHSSIKKTPEEIEELKRKRKKKEAERKARRETQEQRVAEKQLRKDEKKRRREERKARGENEDEDSCDADDSEDEAPPSKRPAKRLVHDEGSEDDATFEEDAGSPDEAEAVKAVAPIKTMRFERMKAKPPAKKISGVVRAARITPAAAEHGFQVSDAAFPRGQEALEANAGNADVGEEEAWKWNRENKTRHRGWKERKVLKERKLRKLGM